MTDSAQPVAGWYPDPENATAERWWDGGSWTDHRRPSTVPIVPPPVAPADPQGFAAPGASLAGAGPLAPGDPGRPAPSATVSPYATPYAAPSAPTGYAAPAYAPAQPANSLAVIGLVLALGGLVFSFGGLTCLAGGVVSTAALVRARRMRAQGMAGDRFGMALAGTICGYLLFVLVVAASIGLIALMVNSPGFSSSYDYPSVS